MKKITFLFILLITFFGYSQSIPIDFESSTTWGDFDGGVVTTETNPFNNTDNNSANVGKMVKNAGQVWGGSALVLSAPLDFSNNNSFSLKAYSIKADTKVLFKVENSADAGIAFEKEVTMTSVNAWETLTFDYSSIPTNTYDKIVIIFDLGTMGDGSENFTYYFDDITLSNVTGGTSTNLPLDFETATSWGDFDGGVVTTETNPFSNSENNSSNVGKMVKSAGQVWGGSSIILSSAMDFTNNNTFSMKAYATKADAKILLKVENSGDASIAFEKEVTMTSTNTWETLTFDYSGIPANTYDKIVIIMDLGTMGDGSENFTYYFDDITLYNEAGAGSNLALPIDFETEPVTSDFIDFDGATASVIVNSQSGGTNTSTNIAQIVRNGGQIWAGSKFVLANNLDFSVQGGISMKVFTTAPVGTTVKFKLEGTGATEVDVLTTVSGAWETLTWDFTGQPADFNTLVFMFDFGNLGDGSATSTFLFDDIEQVDVTGGLTQIDLPVDFEGTTVNYTVTDFGGNASSLVVDPTDATNMVIQSVKTSGAETWAGTTIGTASGFITNIPLTLTDSKMNIRVWSPDSGTPIRLKVEDANDATHTCETETNTTVTAGWETIEFDFSNQAPGTESLSVGLANGWVYNKASIFFNFGTDGATAGEKTYYFDDVIFGGLATAGIEDLSSFNFRIFPNPTSNYLQLEAKSNIESIEIFDISGRRIVQKQPNLQRTQLNIAALNKGVYFVKVAIEGRFGSTKLIKN